MTMVFINTTRFMSILSLCKVSSVSYVAILYIQFFTYNFIKVCVCE